MINSKDARVYGMLVQVLVVIPHWPQRDRQYLIWHNTCQDEATFITSLDILKVAELAQHTDLILVALQLGLLRFGIKL